jgi:hypothetical protein
LTFVTRHGEESVGVGVPLGLAGVGVRLPVAGVAVDVSTTVVVVMAVPPGVGVPNVSVSLISEGMISI